MDIFRIFDSLNYLPNLRVAMEAVQDTHAVCEAALCYTGDILDERRDKYSLKYYVQAGQGTGEDGRAHPRHQGHGRPVPALRRAEAGEGAEGRSRACPSTSTPTTPAASTPARILRAADAGVDVVDLAIASMSGSTSQPNLNSHRRRPAAHAARHRARPRRRSNEFSDYWEQVRALLRAVRHRAQDRQRRGLSARDAGRPVHEPQGAGRRMGVSQPLARDRPHLRRGEPAVRRHREGDAVVRRSSATWRCSSSAKGIRPADVVNLEPGSMPFPESVIDMLSGGLGWPEGGWPGGGLARRARREARQAEAAGATRRRGAARQPRPRRIHLEQAARGARRRSSSATPTDDDLYSHLMYPQVLRRFREAPRGSSATSACCRRRPSSTA